MASSDEDEDLQLAIELSMQQSSPISPTINAVPSSPSFDEATEDNNTETIPRASADDDEYPIFSRNDLMNEVRHCIQIAHSDSSLCQILSSDNLSFTLKDLKEQRHKCILCTVLWDGITAALGPDLADVMTDVDIRHRGVSGDGPLVISVRYHMAWNRILQFYCTRDSILPWPEIGFCPEVGLTGLSSETIERIKQWIRTCDSGNRAHMGCKRYDANAARLPRRVIHVGTCDEDPVHLHVPNENEVGRYVALSHCWGSKTPIMTTVANYQRHTSNITLPLPKTFMDAVLVVRALGVQYLWIDSLCIIQDSSRDWSEQAPQMASIYGNAYCTISADAAENSSDGFIEGSRRVGHTPHVIKFTHLEQECAVHVRAREDTMPEQPLHDFNTLAFRQRGDRGCFQVDNTITGAPYSKLFSRAWVFQERLLSRRTLHFGHTETGWECCSLVDCECSPHQLSYNPMDTYQLSLKTMMEEFPWIDILQRYTKLDITVPTDRLVAVSGLAKERYLRSRVPYFAGLWADKITAELLWQVGYRRINQRPPTRLPIAPTWSWASMSGDINWQTGRMLHENRYHKECCLDWRVLSVEMASKGFPDMFSATVRAILTIEGLLVEVIINDSCVEERSSGRSETCNVGIEKEQVVPKEFRQDVRASIYWDIGYDEQLDYTFFVTSHPREHMQGIILTPADEQNTYTRCGMFDVAPSYAEGPRDPFLCWLEYLEMREFHLI